MTLFKQLFLGTSIAFLVVLGATETIYIRNAHKYLQEELASHAQETATSLGMVLATAMAENDVVRAEVTVNALFDRSYYQSIRAGCTRWCAAVVRQSVAAGCTLCGIAGQQGVAPIGTRGGFQPYEFCLQAVMADAAGSHAGFDSPVSAGHGGIAQFSDEDTQTVAGDRRCRTCHQ